MFLYARNIHEVTMSCRIIFLVTFVISFNNFAAAEVPHNRIFGGEDARLGEFPHMVHLNLNGRIICGGSIISSKHILTAAHCTVGLHAPPYTNSTVISGTISLSRGGEIHRISRISIHPKYKSLTKKSAIRYDVSVITLTAPISFNWKQRPIDLPDRDVQDGDLGVAIGWGIYKDKVYPDILQKLYTIVYSAPTCRLRTAYHLEVLNDNFCIIEKAGRGTCFGDSGSSMVRDETLIGIPSLVISTCSVSKFNVFANVYTAKEYILNEMKGS